MSYKNSIQEFDIDDTTWQNKLGTKVQDGAGAKRAI